MSKEERTFAARSFCTGLGRAGGNGGINPLENCAWVSPEYSLDVNENTHVSTPKELRDDHDRHCPGPEHLILIDVGDQVK
jgi:hypothetical protein